MQQPSKFLGEQRIFFRENAIMRLANSLFPVKLENSTQENRRRSSVAFGQSPSSVREQDLLNELLYVLNIKNSKPKHTP